MGRSLIYLLVAFSTPALAWANSIPSCWTADQPAGAPPIQEGLYRILVPTSQHSALQIAEVVGGLSEALIRPAGVAIDPQMEHLEFDAVADVTDWTATAAFPTLASFKQFVRQSLSAVVQVPGVVVECAPMVKRHPAP